MIDADKSQTIDKLRQDIDVSLNSFLQTVKKDYRLHLVSPLLFESIREFTLREGKRLRPLLLILTYQAYAPYGKKISKELFHASTCMEFLHNFMLIHDDIIDRSDLRRGRPTLHKILAKTVATTNPGKLGTDLGIIAGDIIYALAIDAFLSIYESPQRKERALKYFIQTAAFTAMGEFIDTVHGVTAIDHITEKDVFLNYTLKTARYTFDCPMVTGAILAGAPEGDIKKISEFGILTGQAFQIQDDIIGIFETEKNIGKPIISDLAEGKKTIMVVHSYKTLKEPQRTQFLKIFNKKDKSLKDLEKVKNIFVTAGSLKYALKAVETRLHKAHWILQNLKMHRKYRDLIEQSLLKLFAHSQKMEKLYQS